MKKKTDKELIEKPNHIAKFMDEQGVSFRMAERETGLSRKTVASLSDACANGLIDNYCILLRYLGRTLAEAFAGPDEILVKISALKRFEQEGNVAGTEGSLLVAEEKGSYIVPGAGGIDPADLLAGFYLHLPEAQKIRFKQRLKEMEGSEEYED